MLFLPRHEAILTFIRRDCFFTSYSKTGPCFAGPGHNAEIITDDEGTDWFLYHAIPKKNPLLDNGASRRPLMLDKLEWEDGWPIIQNQQPSITTKQGPVFE